MRSAMIMFLGSVCLSACTEDEQRSGPPSRSSSFERTDRIFEDNDDDPSCFNDDGSNATIRGDLTTSLRQEAPEGSAQQNFGPLQGGAACSKSSKTYAGGYYAATGVPALMGEWCEKYGLAPDCQSTDMRAARNPNGVDLQITYFNAHALPVFRVTLCNNEDVVDANGDPIIKPDGTGFACVNLNYICPERVSGGLKTDANGVIFGNTFADSTCNPKTDANCQQCEAVSVTMHYDVPPGGSEPTVIFAAYRGVGQDAPLMDRIDLDFSGIEDPYEVIPNICNNCHGGRPYEPSDFANPTVEDVSFGAQFLPINPRFALRDRDELLALYDSKATDFAADSLMHLSAQQANLPIRADGTVDTGSIVVERGKPTRFDNSPDLEDAYAINKLFLKTNPLPGTKATLEALDTFSGTPGSIPLLHEAKEVPPGWQGVSLPTYRLVAEHCNDSCHLALPAELGLQTFADFIEFRDNIYFDLCRDYSMPQSPEAFNLFWSKSSRVGAASRGDDVERFLAIREPGWTPLNEEGDCPIPPMAFGAALGLPEFVSPLVFEKKKQACISEIALEKQNGGSLDVDDRNGSRIRNCEAICQRVVLESRFEKSAAINRRECARLRDDLGLIVPAL